MRGSSPTCWRSSRTRCSRQRPRPSPKLRDLALSSPDAARAIARLHQAYAAAQNSARALAAQVLDREDVPGWPQRSSRPTRSPSSSRSTPTTSPSSRPRRSGYGRTATCRARTCSRRSPTTWSNASESRCGCSRSARWRERCAATCRRRRRSSSPRCCAADHEISRSPTRSACSRTPRCSTASPATRSSPRTSHGRWDA